MCALLLEIISAVSDSLYGAALVYVVSDRLTTRMTSILTSRSGGSRPWRGNGVRAWSVGRAYIADGLYCVCNLFGLRAVYDRVTVRGCAAALLMPPLHIK